MKGHPTPMGVFSVIQKQRLHHSNIYSGAPMPYMQRITWSGIAIHAGVLPGYPASHGCIRMPMAFAVKMWNWTKMGARVIVTPGEMTPANFSHPLLVAQKVVPQPEIADEPKTDVPAVKTDKGADAGAAIKSADAEANLELRSTVGHAPSMPLREQTHTADASAAMPSTNVAVTMSDAANSAGNAPAAPSEPAAATADASSTEAKSETPKSEAESAPATSAEATSSDNKPMDAAASEAKSPEAAAAEVKSAEDVKKIDEVQAPAQAVSDAKAEEKPVEAKVEVKRADVKIEAPKAEVTKAETARVDTSKADEPKTVEKPAEPIKAVADAPAPAPADLKKDTARLPGVEKAVAAKS